MLAPEQVSACLVTRGDVNMSEILESIDQAGIEDVLIWNNALEPDLAVYGRYHVIDQARHPVIYCQDDDCVVEPGAIRALFEAYEPGVVTANMPERFRHDFYHEHCLVGFGAAFDRDLPARAFERFAFGQAPRILDGSFYRTCDVTFTSLTPMTLVDLPYRDLPWASAPGRMWTSAGHQAERQRMLDLALQVRQAVA